MTLFKPTSLKTFLTKTLKLSNKQAIELIVKKKVLINNSSAYVNMQVTAKDEIKVEGALVKEPTDFKYIVYYKPRGIESTLNKSIENNLVGALSLDERVFPIGRLDKESEGLMLLTNDGILYEKIAHSTKEQEKEYIVTVDKILTEDALTQLATGVKIMGQQTKSARVKSLTESSFNIILTQGLNRQIRRMCYKLGYEVLELKRIRVVTITLGALKPGDYRELGKDELEILFNALA